ncbi:helix-turn-helix transcriptional regulator [Terrisporobacter sp.]|uniref:helix-turn-helix transcriptional regulator n=1 Tax=Terrisporobacter sp. TaxID=1965305 RepID=UPI00263A0590|nr:helix-turn-helix transcriptional regulator [Terrisporobacter sp.]
MSRKLRIARLVADKTQLQLSEESGISKDYISALERGITKNPSLDTMKKLSKALDVSIIDLFLTEEE